MRKAADRVIWKNSRPRRKSASIGTFTPANGLKSEDAREALAETSPAPDRDEWAAAWSAIADRYASSAAAEESSDKAKAQEDSSHGMALLSVCPLAHAESLPWARKRAYQKAPHGIPKLRALSRSAYGNGADPVRRQRDRRIPLRLPNGVRPAPLVLTISALDSRKEERARKGCSNRNGSYAMASASLRWICPERVRHRSRLNAGAERMFSTVLDYLATRPGNRQQTHCGPQHQLERLLGCQARLHPRKHAYAELSYRGGPVDGYFTPEWQGPGLKTDEYPL